MKARIIIRNKLLVLMGVLMLTGKTWGQIDISVTPPATGYIPDNTAPASTPDYSCSPVTWTPAHNPFQPVTQYTAEVTLTAINGYSFSTPTGATINGQIANEANNTGNEVTLSFQFAATAPIPITAAAITVTAPATGTAPNTAASGTGNFSVGTVTWSPGDNPFQASTPYTAEVTLTANSSYTFTGMTAGMNLTINGNNAIIVDNTGATLTVSFTFPNTAAASYSISLSETGTYLFNSEPYNYGTLSALGVAINNTGNQPTGALTVALSGANSSDFKLITPPNTDIPVSGNLIFTVAPETGLSAAAIPYTATVIVSGSNGILESFIVNFTVTKAQITIPALTQSSFDYNADAYSVSLSISNSAYAIGGQTSEINAGNYIATVSLIDINNYEWTNGSISPQNLPWTINPASVYNTGHSATVPFITTIDLSTLTGLFIIDPNAGTMTYSIQGGTGTGTISGNILTVTAVGTFTIDLVTAATLNYAAGTPVTATLTVTPIPITSTAITVTTPVTGIAMSTLATGTGNFSIGAVTWTPSAGTFQSSTTYTATVTLTANNNYTFTGLTGATINGNNAAIDGNTGSTLTISYTFSTTSITISSAAVTVTAPVTGATPNTTAIGAGNFTIGAVTWTPSASTFLSNTAYTAQVTLTANSNFTFTGLTGATINSANATIVGNTGSTLIISYTFPVTASIIPSAAVTVTAPVTGATPNTTAIGAGNFTIGAVTWSPTESPFKVSTPYSATVTLIANGGYTFTGLTVATINGNNASIDSNLGSSLTISYQFPQTNKLDQTTLTINNPGTKTFSDPAFSLSTTGGSGSGSVTYTFIAGPATVTSAGLVTITGVGNIVVTATKAGDNDYNSITSAQLTITVNKAPGSGSVSLTGWTYGNSQNTPVPISLTNGTSNVSYHYKVQGADDATYSPTVPTNAGNYTIRATFAATTNYTECTATANFTISKAPVTFTALAYDKPYDGNDGATIIGQVGFNGNKESLVRNTDYIVQASFDDENVGNNKTVYITVTLLSSVVANNYYLNNTPLLNAYLTKASITEVTVLPPTAVTGLVYNTYEQTGVVGGSQYYDVTNGSATNAGNYTATVTLKPNYKWSGGSTNALTINWSIAKHPVSLPVVATSLKYDGTSKDGFEEGEHYYVSAGTRTEINAGIYNATVTIHDDDAINYAWAVGSTTNVNRTINWNIAPASLNFTADVENKPYDGNQEAKVTVNFTGNLEPLILGVDFTIFSAKFTNANVGDNKVIVTVNLTSTSGISKNYVLSNTSEDLLSNQYETTARITKKQITFIAEAENKEYDGYRDAKVMITFFDVLADELLTSDDYTVTFARFNNADVGDDKPVSVRVELNETSIANNYVLANSPNAERYNDATANITKATRSTLGFEDPGRLTYGDPPTNLSHTGGGTGNVTFEKLDGPGKIVGNQLIFDTNDIAGDVKIRATQAEDNNYKEIKVDTILKINKATLRITAPNIIITEGDILNTEDIILSYEGFKFGQKSTDLKAPPRIVCEYTPETPAKTLEITFEGGENDPCYDFITTPGKLFISPKDISIKYGESYLFETYDPKFKASAEFSNVVDIIYNDDGTFYAKSKNIGESKIYISIDPFIWVQMKVNKATLIYAVDDAERMQGERNPEFTPYLVNDFVYGQDKSILTQSPTASCDQAHPWVEPGEYQIKIDYGIADNYEFVYNYGILKVLPAENLPTAFIPESANEKLKTWPTPGSNYKVQIFNRLGMLIYEGDDGWDGFDRNNRKVEPGVYYYIAIPPKTNHTIKGSIEVIYNK